MRNIDSGILAILAAGEAIEPINILSVSWADGDVTWYADKGIIDQENVRAKILQVSNITDAQQSDSSGSTGAVTIKLDDSNGELKAIFDGTDIHKKRAKLYQSLYSETIGFAAKFLVLAGQISSPIIWDEGDRTLTFDIVTQVENQEVGFSAEMGAFNLVDQGLIGTSWPMVFGLVQHIPALQLQNIPTAFTAEPFGTVDMTVKPQIANLQSLLALAILATLYFTEKGAEESGTGPLALGYRPDEDPDVQRYVQMQVDIQEQIQILQAVNNSMGQFVKGSVPLIPTVNVTHKFSGQMRVGNNLFAGQLNNFRGNLECRPLMQPGDFAGKNLKVGPQFYDAGTQVVIADDYTIEFLVSITPGAVIRVYAMQSFNGLKRMAKVPTAYYTVHSRNYGIPCTVVRLKQPLSTLSARAEMYTQNWENNFGQYLPPHIVNKIEWEDQLYVTFESSIGPNPVDIMIYLISTYTNNSYDTGSFSAVSAAISGLPMHFMLAAQPNVMSFLQEIAYQARCIIYLRNDVFFLLYLGQKPTSVDTLTESDIIVGSLQVTTTNTEQLVTKYTATYRPDYSPVFQQPVKVILRYNIKKYGTHAEEHDFYCFNNFYAVEKAATFWMIRKANTWKILKAKLLISKLNLEVFDGVTLSFDQPYISDEDVVGLITSCSYDSENHAIDVEIWTPVRAGEKKPYTFGWMSEAKETDIFPTYRETQAGAGGGISGGASLPQSNPDRNPVGVGEADASFADGELGEIPGLGDRQNWTQGDPHPAGYQGIPAPDPREQSIRQTPTPQGAPIVDYSYPDFDDPKVPELMGCYPGRILEYVGPSKTNKNVIQYKVEVYTRGISGLPKVFKVGQLQIDPDDRIPKGTWTVVMVNQFQDATDKTKINSEKTMQVPVWLA